MTIKAVCINREGCFPTCGIEDFKVKFGILKRQSQAEIIKQPILFDSREKEEKIFVFWETNNNFLYNKNHLKWTFGKQNTSHLVTSVETTMIDKCHYIHKSTIDVSSVLNKLKKFFSAKILYLVESSNSFSDVHSFILRNPFFTPARLSVALTSDNQYGDRFFRHFLTHFADQYPLLSSHINVGDFVDRGYLIKEFKNYFWLPLSKISFFFLFYFNLF